MPKLRYKLLFWFLGICAFAMAMTAPEIIRAWRQKKAVERTFAEYSAALVNKQFDNAYRYCGKDFRQVASFPDFVGHQQDLQSKFGNLKSVKARGIVVTVKASPPSQTAVIKADLEYEVKELRVVYEFHYEDGRWALYGYKQM